MSWSIKEWNVECANQFQAWKVDMYKLDYNLKTLEPNSWKDGEDFTNQRMRNCYKIIISAYEWVGIRNKE